MPYKEDKIDELIESLKTITNRTSLALFWIKEDSDEYKDLYEAMNNSANLLL